MERNVLVVWAFEAAVPVTVGSEHVVIGEQMRHAKLLDAFEVGAERSGIRPDLVVREHRPDLHHVSFVW